MFNLITPKKRDECSKELAQMFDLIEKEYGPHSRDKFDHDEAQYLVYSHKKFGVIGGARLIPIDEMALTTDLLKRLKFQSKHKIWEISRIFFHLPHEKAKDEKENMFDLICRDFYQNMYDSLKTISIAQKIRTFVTVLPVDEHHNVLSFGLWPFEKQGQVASPYNDGEQFVFGYMPMNEQTYDMFINRRSTHENVVRVN